VQTNLETADSSMNLASALSGRDRRMQERVTARFDVRFARIEEAARALRAFSVNLSKGGLCLRTQRSYESGSTVHVYMDVAGETFVLEGVIAWVREDSEGLGANYVGVRFLGLSRDDRERLESLVQTFKR
jgi:uncharacterized protein (TIGR02266 family)